MLKSNSQELKGSTADPLKTSAKKRVSKYTRNLYLSFIYDIKRSSYHNPRRHNRERKDHGINFPQFLTASSPMQFRPCIQRTAL
jgi:hypothetical protein